MEPRFVLECVDPGVFWHNDRSFSLLVVKIILWRETVTTVNYINLAQNFCSYLKLNCNGIFYKVLLQLFSATNLHHTFCRPLVAKKSFDFCNLLAKQIKIYFPKFNLRKSIIGHFGSYFNISPFHLIYLYFDEKYLANMMSLVINCTNFLSIDKYILSGRGGRKTKPSQFFINLLIGMPFRQQRNVILSSGSWTI